jgi:hypothetical protein
MTAKIAFEPWVKYPLMICGSVKPARLLYLVSRGYTEAG